MDTSSAFPRARRHADLRPGDLQWFDKESVPEHLAAESNGFLAGVEAAEYVRMLVMEITHPDVPSKDLDQEYLKSKILCLTDAKSLEATLNKDTAQPSDRRVRILVAQIKEMIGENNYEDSSSAYAVWVDTFNMLAEVLMKLGCERGSGKSHVLVSHDSLFLSPFL